MDIYEKERARLEKKRERGRRWSAANPERKREIKAESRETVKWREELRYRLVLALDLLERTCPHCGHLKEREREAMA